MSYRKAACTTMLALFGMHWSLVLLVNVGLVDLPREFWLPWVLVVAIGGNLSWLAMLLAAMFENPARWGRRG